MAFQVPMPRARPLVRCWMRRHGNKAGSGYGAASGSAPSPRMRCSVDSTKRPTSTSADTGSGRDTCTSADSVGAGALQTK